MPTRAPKPCAAPGCAALVRGGGPSRCPAHARKPWDHGGRTRQERGYGRLARPVACTLGRGQHATWDSLRACILERDGHVCGYCPARATTADHCIPKGEGGTDDEVNLVAACARCQQRKAGREGAAARR